MLQSLSTDNRRWLITPPDKDNEPKELYLQMYMRLAGYSGERWMNPYGSIPRS